VPKSPTDSKISPDSDPTSTSDLQPDPTPQGVVVDTEDWLDLADHDAKTSDPDSTPPSSTKAKLRWELGGSSKWDFIGTFRVTRPSERG